MDIDLKTLERNVIRMSIASLEAAYGATVAFPATSLLSQAYDAISNLPDEPTNKPADQV